MKMLVRLIYVVTFQISRGTLGLSAGFLLRSLDWGCGDRVKEHSLTTSRLGVKQHL